MKKIVIILFLFVACNNIKQPEIKVSAETAAQELIHEQTNNSDQENKPYVILVSIDGFRYDYAKKYGATNLLSFKVKAEKMIPAFPSKTFPNHYGIATGLYPGKNGLVSNDFYDRSLGMMYESGNKEKVRNPAFYSGKPIWVLASEQHMVSASMFWVGSEAPIDGVFPTYSYRYNGNISNQDRVNQVVKWLMLPNDKRPHWIGLYFSITDDVGHRYGPDSPEIEKAVQEIDNTIGDLKSKVDDLGLPVNIIVVSDHGMIEIDRDNLIYMDELYNSRFTVSKSFPTMVYSDDTNSIDSLYREFVKDTTRYSVFLKDQIPSRYHYHSAPDRIGDLIIMPKPPYSFGSKSKELPKGASTHGYDPLLTPEMGAIFYATGPAFKEKTIAPFENVNVYPLMAHILGLKYNKDSIDGSFEVLKPILK